MKKILQLLAAALIVVALGYWAATGANRGWTKTSVPNKTLDEITGIEGISYEKKFVPGVDFLGSAVAVAGVLALASFFFRSKNAGARYETELEDEDT